MNQIFIIIVNIEQKTSNNIIIIFYYFRSPIINSTKDKLKYSGVSFCFLFILFIVNEKMIFLWSHTCKAGNPDSMCQCNDFLFFCLYSCRCTYCFLFQGNKTHFFWKKFLCDSDNKTYYIKCLTTGSMSMLWFIYFFHR